MHHTERKAEPIIESPQAKEERKDERFKEIDATIQIVTGPSPDDPERKPSSLTNPTVETTEVKNIVASD